MEGAFWHGMKGSGKFSRPVFGKFRRQLRMGVNNRVNFKSLSKDMFEVIKVSNSETPVYYQFCPMADSGKGANWLSLRENIKNPYYGSQMLSCGKTVETIK